MLKNLLLPFWAIVSASTLKRAIAAAATNDVIVVCASFNVLSTIKIKKSLRLQVSGAGVTIGFTGASPPLTTYGVREFDTSKLKVSFQGLTFDGFSIERMLPGIYVVRKGKTRAGNGPQVLCTGFVMRGFRLVDQDKQVVIDARVAALSANIGLRVSILFSTVRDNFAAAGGALQSTGHSQVYLCQVTFANNGADPATSPGGVPASAAQDVWVGRQSSLVMLSRSLRASVGGNVTSSIVDDPTLLESCPNVPPEPAAITASAAAERTTASCSSNEQHHFRGAPTG
eukprot:jgi/Mesen1/6930/ME000036S06258